METLQTSFIAKCNKFVQHFPGEVSSIYFCEELIQINFTIKQLNEYVLEAKILWGKIIFWPLSTSFAPNGSSLQGNANK